MIAQISIGEGFGGLVNYANDNAKKDTVIIASEGVNLSLNATITASFKAQAKARPTLHKFVGHISLSFSPEDLEKLDDKKIAEIARSTCGGWLWSVGLSHGAIVVLVAAFIVEGAAD